MPVPGVNVLSNPDFSSGQDYWISGRTWDPLLAWGVLGQTISLVEQGPPAIISPGVLRLDFGASTQLDASTMGYGGLLYGGYGFDAEPGDTWRIKFNAVRHQFQAPYHGVLLNSLGQGNDLFIRFGIVLQDESGDWISYYKNLPAYTTNVDGGLIAYDETFEVPSNWPPGTYQFALCHTGSYPLPPQNATQDYKWGFRVDFSDPWLEFVSNGGGSPGPDGVPNPYVSWPTPRWAPGSPLPYRDLGGGGCCCGVIEWDPFQFRSPMTSDRAELAALDHISSAYAFRTTGTAGTYLISLDEIHGAYEEARAGSCTSCYIANDDGNPATPVPTASFGGGTYDSTQMGWTHGCGDWCMWLMTYYCAVEGRENLFFTFGVIQEWFEIPAFVPTIVHPSVVHYPGGNGVIFGLAVPSFVSCGTEVGGPLGHPSSRMIPDDQDVLFCSHFDCSTEPPPPGGGGTQQPLYLTHEVAPGDPHIPAGGTGGLNLRGLRAAPGDANAAATGTPGVDLGHIKGQP